MVRAAQVGSPLRKGILTLFVAFVAATVAGAADAPGRSAGPDLAPQILKATILKVTDVKGGLIVHVGCGDGKLTAALHASDAYLVHPLGA